MNTSKILKRIREGIYGLGKISKNIFLKDFFKAFVEKFLVGFLKESPIDSPNEYQEKRIENFHVPYPVQFLK